MGDFRKTVIDGEAYVLVPEEDFEDLMDIIAAQQTLARIRAGEETWPAELVYELWETDSRIRTFRTYRGLTIEELAEQAGLSSEVLSGVEAGAQDPSTEALQQIAKALRVDLDDLVVEAVGDDHQ